MAGCEPGIFRGSYLYPLFWRRGRRATRKSGAAMDAYQVIARVIFNGDQFTVSQALG
jgi:hypothetical protein